MLNFTTAAFSPQLIMSFVFFECIAEIDVMFLSLPQNTRLIVVQMVRHQKMPNRQRTQVQNEHDELGNIKWNIINYLEE